MRPEHALRCAVAVAALALAGVASATLPRAVARAFQDNGVPLSSVAVYVERSGEPRPKFSHQPDLPMNPASVMKLVTTWAALNLLNDMMGPSEK